jgi:hypothetical protein
MIELLDSSITMESTKDNPTEDTQAGAESTPAAVGEEAVSTSAESLSLEELNQLTGLNFNSKESALKSIKDMQSHAGKVSDLEGRLKQLEQTPEERDSERDERIKALELDNFFARNQEHEENRTLLEKIAKADNISVAEAINTNEYQSVFQSQQSAQAIQSKRTIAESNNRVTQGETNNEPSIDEFRGNPEKAADYVREKFFSS